MQWNEEAPDRKFWTEYDYIQSKKEERALRRAEIYALPRKLWQRARSSKLWQRVAASLVNAGAQPPKQAQAR